MTDIWKRITRPLGVLPNTRNTRDFLENCDRAYDGVARLLDDIERRGNFVETWIRIRALVPLQVRLVAEQLMWDRGGAYRKLVTGFKPASRPEQSRPSGTFGAGELFAEFNRMVESGVLPPDAPVDEVMLRKRLAIANKVRNRQP